VRAAVVPGLGHRGDPRRLAAPRGDVH
jgi:hypothetical protein